MAELCANEVFDEYDKGNIEMAIENLNSIDTLAAEIRQSYEGLALQGKMPLINWVKK